MPSDSYDFAIMGCYFLNASYKKPKKQQVAERLCYADLNECYKLQERFTTSGVNNMATTKRELFDAAEYSAKMDAMVEKLRLQKPGEAVGLVGKTDVLMSKREDLKKLIVDGYTIAQIVEAMKNDVFGILPKTITEILGNKTKKPRVTKKVVDASKTTQATPTRHEAATKPANKKQVGDAGSISVTEDSKDL